MRLHGARLRYGAGARNDHRRSNGLLADFFDVDELAEKAVAVLKDPPAYRSLGEHGVEMIQDRYALDVTLPKIGPMVRAESRGKPTVDLSYRVLSDLI